MYKYFKDYDEISFHMPGHKGKLDCQFVDTTEIEGTDNLQSPWGIIKNAQERMAKTLNKKETFFLTNGATGGIISSILSNVSENEEVLVDRNCHISVINGLIISGGIPKFIYPKVNCDFGIPYPISINDFSYNNENTTIITSPTYYGDTSNYKEIKSKIKDSIFICDEAHGSHFYYSQKLKAFKNDFADLSVLSFHKTMPTLNQGAILCVNNDKIDINNLKQIINMLSTTSPSYPILTSLDYANIVGEGIYNNEKNDELERAIFNFITEVENKTPLKIYKNTDFYKLLINFSNTNMNAYKMNEILIKKHKIYAEGVFGENILFMLSPYNTIDEINLLKKVLLENSYKEVKKSIIPFELTPSKQVISPREAFYRKGEFVEKNMAAGRISKENVTNFPPCVPIITMGELITKEVLFFVEKEYLQVIV